MIRDPIIEGALIGLKVAAVLALRAGWSEGDFLAVAAMFFRRKAG